MESPSCCCVHIQSPSFILISKIWLRAKQPSFTESCGQPGVVGGGELQPQPAEMGGACTAHRLTTAKPSRPRSPPRQPQAPDPPAAASSQNGAGLWPRTTHCGTASLPGRCGRAGRATTLSVAGRCPHNGGHCHQAAAGAAATPPPARPQLHRCRRPVESRPPQNPQKSVQHCSCRGRAVTKSCGSQPAINTGCGGGDEVRHDAAQCSPPAVQHVPVRAPSPAPTNVAPWRHVLPPTHPPPHPSACPPAARADPQAEVPVQNAAGGAQPEGEV